MIITKTAEHLFTLLPDGTEYKELTSSDQKKKNRIAEYKKIVMEFESDVDFSGYNLYFTPALFFNASDPQPFVNVIPASAWAYAIDAAATAGDYVMNLSAALPYAPDLIKNFEAIITIVDNTHFNIALKFYQVYDLNDFMNPVLESNQYKLLKDRAASSAILTVTGNSIYNNGKIKPRFYVYLQDPLQPINQATFYDSYGAYEAGFYAKNELNTAPYFTIPIWTLENSAAVVVPSLLLSEPTKVKFKITSAAAPTKILVWLIKTSSYSNAFDMLQSYDASFCQIDTDGTTAQIDNKIYSPSQALTFVSGSDYEAFFHVNNAALAYGETYRFISICYYDDGGSDYEVNSFISDQYTVTALPQFTGVNYEFDASITDFITEYKGNDLKCVVEERLRSSVNISFPGDVFSDDMFDRLGLLVPNDIRRYLTRVTVEVFEDQGAGVIQYFDRVTSSKMDPVTYSAAPGLSLAFTDHSFDAVYDFRARYESWVPNLQTTVGGIPLLTPNSNMNMANRNVQILYTLELFYDDYSTPFSDLIKFTQQVRPDDYGKPLDVLNDDGSSIGATDYYLNNTDPCFKADISTVTDADQYKLITTIEKEPGSIALIAENEEFTGLLPQLDSDKFLNQEVNFSSTEAGMAKFCLDASKFFVNSPYKLSAIAKRVYPAKTRITQDATLRQRITQDGDLRVTQ